MVSQAAAGYVQMRSAAVDSRGESQSDAWIAFALAKRLGFSKLFWDGDIDAGYREMLAPSGIELGNLRKKPGGICVPLQTRYRKYAGNGRDDVPGFNTPSKKVEIYSEVLLRHGYAALPDFVEPGMGVAGRPNLAEEFPLILTSVKSPLYLGSQGRNIPALRRIKPEPQVELHPDTAEARGIQNGEWVALLTPHGQLRVKAQFSANLHPKVVVTTHGWWQANGTLSLPGYDVTNGEGANLNAAFANETIDPIGGAVPHKCYACQIVTLDEAPKLTPATKQKPASKARSSKKAKRAISGPER
jgi:anaerobic selenocysteine-containing dehydrogenase